MVQLGELAFERPAPALTTLSRQRQRLAGELHDRLRLTGGQELLTQEDVAVTYSTLRRGLGLETTSLVDVSWDSNHKSCVAHTGFEMRLRSDQTRSGRIRVTPNPA